MCKVKVADYMLKYTVHLLDHVAPSSVVRLHYNVIERDRYNAENWHFDSELKICTSWMMFVE